ncbi:MAG: GNAT family N-acetyltransferase [Pseudomonadota bacterium]
MFDALEIHKATYADLDNLWPLYRELNPGDGIIDETAARNRLETLEKYPGSVVLIGTVENIAVTSCTLIVIPNLARAGRPYALIENVVTSASNQKKGYGKAILEEAINRAWQEDCYKVMLLTGSKDPGTILFYEKCGFSQTKIGFQIRNGVPANPRNKGQ